jgi:hypothetical protein
VILFLKIVADPLLEISGLADIDDVARTVGVATIVRAVQEEVASWQMRERIQGVEGDHVSSLILEPK